MKRKNQTKAKKLEKKIINTEYLSARDSSIFCLCYMAIYTGGVYTHVIVVFIIGAALLRSSRSLLLGFGRAEALYYTLYIHTKSLSITSVSYCR